MFINTGKERKVESLINRSRDNYGYQYQSSGINPKGTQGFYHLQHPITNRVLRIQWQNKQYSVEFITGAQA